MLERAIAIVEEDYLAPYIQSGHFLSQLLDQRSPDLRQQVITLLRQEAEALRALNPDTVTLEEITQTRQQFEDRIKLLYEQSASI